MEEILYSMDLCSIIYYYIYFNHTGSYIKLQPPMLTPTYPISTPIKQLTIYPLLAKDYVYFTLLRQPNDRIMLTIVNSQCMYQLKRVTYSTTWCVMCVVIINKGFQQLNIFLLSRSVSPLSCVGYQQHYFG